MAIFGPKPWVNPFGKISIFRLFELSIFIAQKGVFSFYKIVKDVFLADIAKKKKLVKCSVLEKNQALTPLEKCQFFHFLNFLFFIAQNSVFIVLKYRKRRFPGRYCLQLEVGKMVIFGAKPWVNPFGKISIFRLFDLLVFKA